MKLVNNLLAGTGGKSRYLLIGIIAVAFVIRLGMLFGFTDFNSSSNAGGDPYPEMATRLLHNQGLSVYVVNKGIQPITTHGPLYPALAAAVLFVSGNSWLIVRLAQLLLSVASVLLVFHVARRAADVAAGIVAAALVTIYLPLVQFSSELLTETLFTFLLILILYLGLRLVQEWTGRLALFLGVAMGLLALTKFKGIFVAVIFLPLFLFIGRKRKLPLRWAVVPCLVALLVYSPWVVRNSLIEHTFVPMGSGAGNSLISGMPAKEQRSVYKGVKKSGTSAQRNDTALKRGIEEILKKPGSFIAGSGRHFLQMWLNLGFDKSPSKGSILFALTNSFSLLAGAAGAVAMWRRGGPGRDLVSMVTITLIAFTAIHMATLADGRYSVPLLPLVFVVASLPLARVYAALLARRSGDRDSVTAKPLKLP